MSEGYSMLRLKEGEPGALYLASSFVGCTLGNWSTGTWVNLSIQRITPEEAKSLGHRVCSTVKNSHTSECEMKKGADPLSLSEPQGK